VKGAPGKQQRKNPVTKRKRGEFMIRIGIGFFIRGKDKKKRIECERKKKDPQREGGNLAPLRSKNSPRNEKMKHHWGKIGQ